MRNCLLLSVAALAACTSPYQKDGTSCPAAVCSDHGTCAYENTYPACTCGTGYAGEVCSMCASGYHRAADDSCVANAVCMPTMCANGGMCGVSGGVTSCACLPGYTGMTCADCAAGFHASTGDGGVLCAPDESCTGSTCSNAGTCWTDGGTVGCTCNSGVSGPFCETPDASCAVTNPCSANGTCEDSTGVIACNCAPGYGGPTCSTCYPGYSPTDAGTCEPGQTCGPSSCSFAGACAADGGVTSCSCNTGYTGATCATCATGYHRGAGYACVADETCAANQCGPHGSCTVSGGVAGCICDTGWAGLACDACYPGYHAAAVDGGTTCTLDVSCDSTTCRGNGTCAQDGGVVSCACDPGYTGDFCQTSVDNCVNNACGAGQCIDTAQGYLCLCPGIDGGSGQWGNSCP